MRFTSLLLLLLFLAVSVPAATPQSGQSAPMVATVENLPSLSDSVPQSFQLTPTAPRDDNSITSPDDVCYKIRAYIFKRDDDHAPEFVRSTTCPPGRPHAKNADWPKAKLVPAK